MTMQRILFVFLVGLGFTLARTAVAGDKKVGGKSLIDDAQTLAGKDWMSIEKMVRLSSKKEDPKVNLTIRFYPDKGKPSGEAALGVWADMNGSGAGVAIGGYAFELIDDGGVRAMKLIPRNADGNEKPRTTVPRFFHYKLDGDKLTIRQPPLPDWPIEPARLDFERSK
jgi:hypothetical protein